MDTNKKDEEWYLEKSEYDIIFRRVYYASPIMLAMMFHKLLPSFEFLLQFMIIQVLVALGTYIKLTKYVKLANNDTSLYSVAPIVTKSGDNNNDNNNKSKNRSMHRRLSKFEGINFADVNPFVNRTWKISEHQRFRLALASCTVVPLRIICLIFIIIIMWIFAKICTWGLKSDELKKPLEQWRKWLRYPVVFCGRAALWIIGYYYIPTRGERASKTDAPIVIANHISFVETVYMACAFQASPVGAAEHLKAPIISDILKCVQIITVDRRSPTSRKDVIEAMLERSKSPDTPQILIFPEGTTTNGRALITFKNGAFIPGVPIQPCVISYERYSRFDPSWLVAGPSVTNIFFRLLAQPANYMQVEFLKPYVPNEEEKTNPRLYAKNVRAYMAEAMQDVKISDHSYEDVLLQKEALKGEMPPEAGLIEFGKLRNQMRLSFDALKENFEVFKKMDTSKSGYVSLSEFCKFYNVGEENEVIRNLFNLLDDEEKGVINFRQYLIGLGLANDLSQDSISKLAFRMFDTDGDGQVQKDDLQKIFHFTFQHMSDEEISKIFSNVSDTLTEKSFIEFANSDPNYVEAFRKYFFL